MNKLPKPTLDAATFGGIICYTDKTLFDQVGVRVAFTTRAGGVSEGSFGGLNLGQNTADEIAAVERNRELLLDALGAQTGSLVSLNQVHGNKVLRVQDGSAAAITAANQLGASGADGVVVSAPGVSALLCFADCVALVIVSPTGNFAVVHAGWKGVMLEIAKEAIEALMAEDARVIAGAGAGGAAAAAEATGAAAAAGAGAGEDAPSPTIADAVVADSAATPTVDSAAAAISAGPTPAEYNVYIGAHIHKECFEVSADLHHKFTDKFGAAVAADPAHIDLGAALRHTLYAQGILPENVCDLGICTSCNPQEFYSYRKSQGMCGRHGALAFRELR